MRDQIFGEIISFIRQQFPASEFIPLHEPYFPGNERKYVAECFDTRFVSSVGKFVDRFERSIQEYTGAAYAIATVNGTAALHTALLLAGVTRDDLVVTQPLTFIATCNAISYIGAEPVFVDIDRETLGLSAAKFEAFISEACYVNDEGYCYHKASKKRIAACVPMHTFGHPVDIDALADVCRRHHIVLIEDAAESIGSFNKGRHTGVTGFLGAFSFNGNKTITCGGGGVLVTNDAAAAQKAKHLTTQAKVPHAWEFVHDMIGYNYRMPNINAAIACAQLEQIESFVENKRQLSMAYADFFASAGISFIKEPSGCRSNYWLNAILLNDLEERNAFLKYTNDNGVMTRPVWQLMNKLPMFRHCISANLDTAEDIATRLVNLPSSIRIQHG